MTHLIARARQRGAVLIVSLIMLVVMTMFVISMLKTAVIELKIGGASHVAALNMSNAEVALVNFINVNNGNFAPDFLTKAAGSPGAAVFTPPALYGGTVTLTGQQLGCSPTQKNGDQISSVGGTGSTFTVQFDIRAEAQGDSGWGGRTILHQGAETTVGSC